MTDEILEFFKCYFSEFLKDDEILAISGNVDTQAIWHLLHWEMEYNSQPVEGSEVMNASCPLTSRAIAFHCGEGRITKMKNVGKGVGNG